jgi:hypothetical protein
LLMVGTLLATFTISAVAFAQQKAPAAFLQAVWRPAIGEAYRQ